MNFSCLGYDGNRYYVIGSEPRKQFFELRKMDSSELIKIMSHDEWVANYPKKNKAGDVYAVNWKQAASDIITACHEKGEYKPNKDELADIRPPCDAELYQMIGDAINRDNGSALPEFPTKFFVIKTETGEREILKEIGSGVVQIYSEYGLVSEILSYCRELLRGYEQFDKFTTKHAENAASDWIHTTRPIEMPEAVLTLSQSGFCFHRLPFDPNIELDTPIFDEFISRCTNSMALKCFIGSLFIKEADRQQYVWMWGEGQNGKGAIQRFLSQLMGPAYIAKVPPDKNGDRFWTSNLLGKRLVALPDCNDAAFPASGTFKMLTGDDQVPIEKKRKDGYSCDLSCKFIFGSNETPQITGQKSDLRRAIYCEIEPIKSDPDPQYNKKLWNEAAGIVGKCLECYQEEIGDSHGQIPTYDDCLESIIQQNDDEWHAVFDTYFKLDERKGLKEGERYYFTGTQLISLFKKIFRGDYEAKRKNFIKWLSYQKHVRRKSVRLIKDSVPDEKPTKVYIGAKRNSTLPFHKALEEKDFAKDSFQYD